MSEQKKRGRPRKDVPKTDIVPAMEPPKKKGPGGRPRKIACPEDFDAAVDAYVRICEETGQPILLMGMILAVGLLSKKDFYQYGNEYPEFRNSVKRARAFVEIEYEKRLNTNPSAAGAIFALKNFGWTDKTTDEAGEQRDDQPAVVKVIVEDARRD